MQAESRCPVYASGDGELWPAVMIGTGGVLAGTIVGILVLRRIPEKAFRRIVGVLVLGIGIYMLFRPG
jgi:uncharacterized membrane protein YfcA